MNASLFRRLRAPWALPLLLLSLAGLLGAAPARAQVTLSFTQPPTGTAVGRTITPTVVVGITGGSGSVPSSVTLTLTDASGNAVTGVTLNGTTNQPVAENLQNHPVFTYTFPDLSVSGPGTYTLTATPSNGGASPVQSTSFTVTIPVVASFTQPPPASVVSGQPIQGAGTPPGVTVQVTKGGTAVSGAAVTLSLNGNGTLSGTGATTGTGTTTSTTGTTDAGGNVTFTGLTVDLQGTGDTLTANVTDTAGDTIDPVTSSAFTVTPALGVAFIQQPPPTTPSGATITPPVTVHVTSLGAGQSAANQTVTISLQSDFSGTGRPILAASGTTSGTPGTTASTTGTTDANGNLSFTGLNVSGGAGNAYTLQATVTDNGGNQVLVNTGTSTLTPGAPAILTFTQQPGSPGLSDTTSIALGLPLDSGTANPGVQVTVTDGTGNPVPGASVTLLLSGQTGTLTGTTTEAANASGVATFLDLRAQPLGTYSLEATAGSAPHVFSSMFNVVADPVPNNVVTSAADDGGFGTLRSVLAYLPAVKTATFLPSLFDSSPAAGGSEQTITLLGHEIDVTQSVTVTAPPNGVFVSGNGNSRVFGVLGGTVGFTNLLIENGAPAAGDPFFGSGGGIYNDANLTLNTCLIGSTEFLFGPGEAGGPGSNTAVNGGGVFNDAGGTLSLTGGTFVAGNTADVGGGLANLGTASLTTTPSVNEFFSGFFGNAAASAGGGLANAGTLTMTGGFVGGLIGNTAPDGGAFYNVGGTATLTDETISENLASDGGGVYGAGGTLTLTGCAVTGNGASDGGGLYNAGGALTLTSCTFTANSAGNNNGGGPIRGLAVAPRSAGGLGGGLFTTGGAATLTDDVFFGDTVSGGGVSEIAGPVTATFCDVGQASGVFPGVGNLNADPLFTGGAPFGPGVQIAANSPVLGRGTTGAPAFRPTDLRGLPFFNPPAIGAVEGPEDTHVLWTNPDGRTIFWDVNPQGAQIVAGNYGPPTDPQGNSGYVAISLSTGTNGVSHVLWTRPDGRALLSDVQPDGTRADSFYGPFADDGTIATTWQPVAVSTGDNGTTHILWDNPNGRTILWDVATSDVTRNPGTDPFTVRGNYDGFSDDGTANTVWKAVALANGIDSRSHILWTNPDRHTLLWNLDGSDAAPANPTNTPPASGASSATTYDVFNDDGTLNTLWSARALSVGEDNLPRILWNNPDGRTILWNVNSDGTFVITGNYDPLLDPSGSAGFTAVALATGADSRSHFAWDNPNGETFLWSLLNDGGPNGNGGNDTVSPFFYGIFSDDGTQNTLWKAVAISAAQPVND